jgi:hypothetical protein
MLIPFAETGAYEKLRSSDARAAANSGSRSQSSLRT